MFFLYFLCFFGKKLDGKTLWNISDPNPGHTVSVGSLATQMLPYGPAAERRRRSCSSKRQQVAENPSDQASPRSLVVRFSWQDTRLSSLSSYVLVKAKGLLLVSTSSMFLVSFPRVLASFALGRDQTTGIPSGARCVLLAQLLSRPSSR